MESKTTLTTRNFADLVVPTGNIYESTVIISKRAKQLALSTKAELNDKLAEFVSQSESAEEIFENKEHIEISKSYEKQPKPVVTATQEFLAGKVAHHYPDALEASLET